jgi:4-hydroxybenzoate polyprenyltransferase
MLKRLGIYIKEMFPLNVYVPFAFLNHYILFFTLQIFLGYEKAVLSFYSLNGVITIIGFMLIMRILDELKDEEVDSKLFASRPYPRGAVKKMDLLYLLLFTFLLVVMVNSFRSYTLPFFLICIFYGLLTFKWFFVPERMKKDLLLALVSHQPITYLINIYVVSTAMVQTNVFTWNKEMLLLAFLFFIPVLGWEISRKIKSPHQENEYITYSKTLGFKTSVWLCLVIHLIFSLGVIYLGYVLELSIWNTCLQGAIILCILFIHLRFLYHPKMKHNKLKKTSEIHGALVTLIYIVFFIAQLGLDVQW